MRDIAYRKATAEDCYAIAELKGIVWNTTYKGIYPDEALTGYDVKKNEQILQRIVNYSEIEIYVATDNDRIVGFMTCGKPYKPFRHYEQEVGLLYILKEYQRQGIGAAFLNIARNQVKDAGYEEFMLAVNSKNTNAINFIICIRTHKANSLTWFYFSTKKPNMNNYTTIGIVMTIKNQSTSFIRRRMLSATLNVSTGFSPRARRTNARKLPATAKPAPW